ncbi:hypothetical protein EPUL_000389 [Erysiphe pulchra]|uniref:CPAF-like PDZ domain-containing protein n=1 Tax=Erysiphe pulchra TaxID=225359 RepID=A0A2S4Q148_9PEZI|nr:hypothetical protein EPUL_000389 [Erysiphe pulchra]
MKIYLFTLVLLVLDPVKCLPGSRVVRYSEPPQVVEAPCARVSASASATLKNAPKATPTVAAQLAYECLTSVPLNHEEAIALVEAILPYVEWQSDLSYLKNPPPGYLMPAVDVKAELNRVLKNIIQGKYANEHAFQMDLFQVFQSVHDGHFRFTPDLLGKTIQFRRPIGIVSVSRDGVEVPKIYIESDIKQYANNSILNMPSAVTKVDGKDVTSFVSELMIRNSQHDPDAQYNMMMYGKAYDARFPEFGYKGLFSLGSRLSYFYPGPSTTIQFENGTVREYENYASVIGNFDNVTDGPSMYKKFCSESPKTKKIAIHEAKPITTHTKSKGLPIPPTETEPVEGYPTPHIISSDKLVSGYLLDDPDHLDVAVLVIFSFQAKSVLQTQSVIQTLIAQCLSMGKTKMIIDLSSNSGGNLLVGYDAFRQFFPTLEQPGFSRFRLHEGLKIITKQISKTASNFTFNSTNPTDYDYYQTPFNYRFDLNETNKPFLSYEDKFNPRKFNGDEFTSNMRWDLEDPTMTSSTWGAGMNITGYGNRKDFKQPFNPEDIILLHDGVCASTCAIFSEFMRLEAGVRSVAMGGRPNKEVIQGIGGTKGANSYSFASIHKIANQALDLATPEETKNWTSLRTLSTLPIRRSTDSAINVRDQILRTNLEDGVPAQFIYEPADCRLYFEPKMITDVRAVWSKVASAVWGNSECIAGSMKKDNNAKTHQQEYISMKRPRPYGIASHPITSTMKKGDELQTVINEEFGTTNFL